MKYLVVGGYAVSLYAQPRASKDLDILIKPDKTNAAALFRALEKFGAPLEGSTPDYFMERGSFFLMGTPPVMVDILPEIAGIDFDYAWRRRAMETIDRKRGLKAAFISADELIAAKTAAGRAQDLADVEALYLARARTARGTKPRSRSPAKRRSPKA